MEKTSCLLCGCLTDQLFCPGCSDKGWEQVRAIQTFLDNYPGLATIELCRELSVSLGFIKGLISAGYLNLELPDREKPQNHSSGFHISDLKRR